MRPKVGDMVSYTPIGAGAYYQANGCWPPNNGTLGIVIEHNLNKNVCSVMGCDLKTAYFVWRFSSGDLNSHFKWPNKHGAICEQ